MFYINKYWRTKIKMIIKNTDINQQNWSYYRPSLDVLNRSKIFLKYIRVIYLKVCGKLFLLGCTSLFPINVSYIVGTLLINHNLGKLHEHVWGSKFPKLISDDWQVSITAKVCKESTFQIRVTLPSKTQSLIFRSVDKRYFLKQDS